MHATQSKYHCAVPTLYYDELSPQSRSCYMLIKVLDIEVELQPISLINDEHLNDSYRNVNPSSTIPILIDGQYIISDGHTIMIYLCDKYAREYLPHLCPSDYLPRLSVLNMLFYEGCVLYRRYSHLLTEILLKKYPNVDMSYHQAKVIDSYNSLETNLKGQLCMTGNCLTIADLSIITTLSSLDLMFPISQDQLPNLHRWFENLKHMDCYTCNDEGIQKLSQLLETEGQFPLPSPLLLEATSTMLPLLQSSVDIDEELSWRDRSAVRENEVDKDNYKLRTNESLRKAHSPIKRDITSVPTEDETEIKFSKFFPKIRTSKIIVSPSHADQDQGSLPEQEKLYADPADKKLRDSEVENGVEGCQPETSRYYKAASHCLCCRRSLILNRSKMDCNQKNQRAQRNDRNQNEMSNLRIPGSIQCCDSVESQLNNTIVRMSSAKNPVNKHDINKASYTEFEGKAENKDKTKYYPGDDDQYPCCSAYRQKDMFASDKGKVREFRSCICTENCGPSYPCVLRMAERQKEAPEKKNP